MPHERLSATGFSPDQYQLVDFGRGRKLEQFGPYRLDRPAPAAEGITPAQPRAWATADAQYVRAPQGNGQWEPADRLPEHWPVTWQGPAADVVLQLKATPFGHLGLFPEQAENWAWITRQVRAAARPLKVLNLFAYTGGSTLACAAAGVGQLEVVHVDAAANTVAWARQNATLSGLDQRPIRWLVEDALVFAERECRRGNRYGAVILDPPSFGHGPGQQRWQMQRDLPRLLSLLATLTRPRPVFVLFTCHTPGFPPARMARTLADASLVPQSTAVSSRPLVLTDSQSRTLPSGSVARWPE